MAAIAAEIEGVNCELAEAKAEIDAVKAEISDIVAELRNPALSADDMAALQTEKAQLTKKKQQLRTKEEQLRNREIQLRSQLLIRVAGGRSTSGAAHAGGAPARDQQQAAPSFTLRIGYALVLLYLAMLQFKGTKHCMALVQTTTTP